jgi:hypothetical protein
MRSTYQLALLSLLAIVVAGWIAMAQRFCAEPYLLFGQVTDADGPVAGARVGFKGQCQRTFTDANGRFRLPCTSDTTARVTASKEGFFIAGVPAAPNPLSLSLLRLPADDWEAYVWVDPAPDPAERHNCANCHAEIYREWRGSRHARSATNRRFLNLYDGSDWQGRPHVGWDLLADNPAGAGVCNACHAPTATFDSDLRGLDGVTAKGVHCDYCHKVVDAPTDKIGLAHGRYGLKVLRPTEGQLFIGPLDDVDRNEDSYSPLYKESRYCASCHEGIVFGVHVYSTYSEWLESPARREGKQCQTCHMQPTGTLTNLAPGKGGIARDPQTLASHHFPGGQSDMLRRCLNVTLNLQPMEEEVRADVEVRAAAVGHRVPTGFVDRQVLLVLEGVDANGQPVRVKAGPYLPSSAGKLAGLPGKLYAKQVKDFTGVSPAPFWRGDADVVDTRLVPERPERTVFLFAGKVQRVRLRLIYRRFWVEVAQTKGWPNNELVLVDQMVTVLPNQPVCWCGP